MFCEPLASNGLPYLFVAAETYVTVPLPNNGHICHNNNSNIKYVYIEWGLNPVSLKGYMLLHKK
jgi:hypothetical protein